MQEELNVQSLEEPPNEEKNKQLFSLWRVLVLILLGMVIFNIVMMIFTGKLQEESINSNLLRFIPAILLMSVAGLIITPAPIGLAIYAFSIETLYATRVFKHYWFFCLFGGLMGMAVFIGFSLILTRGEDLDIRMLTPMFVAHVLTTMLVYRNKRKDKNGGFFSRYISPEV